MPNFYSSFVFTERGYQSVPSSPNENTVQYFVGRDRECYEIIKHCNPTSKTKLITIVGLPGIGKSQLLQFSAKKVRKRFPDCLVVKPSVATAKTTLKDFLSDILMEIHVGPSNDSYSCSRHYVKRKLLHINKPLLLLFDISQIPMSSQTWDDMWVLIRGLLLAEDNKLKVLVTMCSCPESSKVNDIESQDILVKELDLGCSEELLQKCAPMVSSEQAALIWKYCGGIPLVLRHMGAHICRGGKVDARRLSVISKCDLPCLRTIMRNSVMFSHFRVVFDSLHKSEKEDLVKLSILPGSFSLRMASIVIGNNQYYSQVEHICDEFYEIYNFLDKDGNGSYRMQNIIRSFLHEISITDKQLIRVNKEAVKRFYRFYLQLTIILDAKFLAKPLHNMSSAHEEFIEDGDSKCKCPHRLNEVEDIESLSNRSCTCAKSWKTLKTFEEHRLCIKETLLEGINHPELWKDTIDSATETVSFLNKALTVPELFEIYDKHYQVARDNDDEMRKAFTLVSLGFIHLVAYGCQDDPKNTADMLFKAKHILYKHWGQLEKLGMLEVLAHCLSKLGLILAANQPAERDLAFDMVIDALDIRTKKVAADRRCEVLIAATYVDFASKF